MKHKNILYRACRDHYFVKVSIDGTTYTRAFKTLKPAIAYRNALFAKRNRKRITRHERPSQVIKRINAATFKEAITTWHETVRQQYIEPGTYGREKAIIKNHLLPYFGAMKVNDISSYHVQTMATELGDRGYAHRTVQDVVTVLRLFYRYYDIPSPCSVQYPRRHIQTAARRRDIFSPEEKTRFLSSVRKEDIRYYLLFRMLFETGCRRGELLGARWSSVNFDTGFLHIEETVVRGVTNVYLKPYPKTVKSIRNVPLEPKTLYILKRIYARYRFRPDQFIFHNSRDRYMDPASVSIFFQKHVKQCGFRKNLSLHSTRHTFVSDKIRANVPLIVIQKLGGWINLTMISQTYAHVTEADLRKYIG